MMTEALPSFLANAALLTLLTLAYLMLSSNLTHLPPLLRQLVLGAAFGAAACARMLMPVELSHGVIYDARALGSAMKPATACSPKPDAVSPAACGAAISPSASAATSS
jgi:hypothetical protein